ncbi:SIR2 family protein [Marinomonas aquiplantarum]|uniref:SIR2-like protein n=1 Tax=Marinomonas aquiplantarum TaxID=491951 RepID=A0A366CW87_9GAMM|nr:SIR2 family protein [Marinomonas aquiplantarum]RBO79731.1 SIR2-like protein [Marinomonas aquiplantarum]
MNDKKVFAKDNLTFKQGQESLFAENDSVEDGIEKIRSKLSDLTNIKNLHFLLGAGASSDAIPAMAPLIKKVTERVEAQQTLEQLASDPDKHDELKKQFKSAKDNAPNNLESLLGTLYSKREYLKGVGQTDSLNDFLINLIESEIYSCINIDCTSAQAELSLGLYKKLYQKLALRNKDLARVNVFTTNNDLLSETALGFLNINYNNGFSSGLSRTFNPARFSYTFSRKVDPSVEKYEPLESMVYLFKLHGSISWIESDDNSFFNIKEVDVTPNEPSSDKNVLIYPTPLKQNKSLGSPYADLIREFQNKLLLQHGVLIVIGYSFSDEHINNAIYSALASNSSLSVIIFGNYHPTENLTRLTDRRIYQISGEIEVPVDGGAAPQKEKIHYFNYIVNNFIPDLDRSKDTEILEEFIKSMKSVGDKK